MLQEGQTIQHGPPLELFPIGNGPLPFASAAGPAAAHGRESHFFRNVSLRSAAIAKGGTAKRIASDRQPPCVHHGANGKGGGSLAPVLNKAPANLTILAKKNNGVLPVGAIYGTFYGINEIMSHGTRDMPIWGNRYAPSPETALVPKPTDRFSVPTYEPDAVIRTRILAIIDYLNRIQEK